MNYGLYLSATGALSSMHRQDVLAHNLANVNTIGFKPDQVDARQRRPERLEHLPAGVHADGRELLDHVIILNAEHLHRLLRDYVAYYNADRVHTRLKDAPQHRPLEERQSLEAKVVGLPRVGGLHHRYVWREAA